MKITMMRTGERSYTTIAMRRDGVTIAIPSPDRPGWLPHDLAHYVVEQRLGLRRGFWGSVADGAIFSNLRVVAGRQPPHAAARSRAILREIGQLGTEAEVLVGIFVGIARERLDPRGREALARVADAWRDPSQPPRPPIGADQIAAICEALGDLQRQWEALLVGESITLIWRQPRQPREPAP
jgi:hypothetical protein